MLASKPASYGAQPFFRGSGERGRLQLGVRSLGPLVKTRAFGMTPRNERRKFESSHYEFCPPRLPERFAHDYLSDPFRVTPCRFTRKVRAMDRSYGGVVAVLVECRERSMLLTDFGRNAPKDSVTISLKFGLAMKIKRFSQLGPNQGN